jgi:hypothetical protein
MRQQSDTVIMLLVSGLPVMTRKFYISPVYRGYDYNLGLSRGLSVLQR